MAKRSHFSSREKRQRKWPKPVDEDAYHGLVGDYLNIVEPHTEADPMGLILQFLIVFSNMIGRGPHFVVEEDVHYLILFGLLVGQTSRGRKGVAFNHILRMARAVDENWADECILSGLSSGEGLIQAVKDSEGNESKTPLLIVESEFGRVLKVMLRIGNILSDILRLAWDGKSLHILTRNNPLSASEPFICIIGHITQEDLLRLLTDTEAANGFGNRFIIICVKRSKLLPKGGRLNEDDLKEFAKKLAASVNFARSCGQMKRNKSAGKLWDKIYRSLAESDSDGMSGALTARAEPQIMRLACVYALLDQSAWIRKAHLKAAYAIWKYADASIRFLYGDDLGNTTADVILANLEENPVGMTRAQIHAIFSRKRAARQIQLALDLLRQRDLVYCQKEKLTGGRPEERYFTKSKAKEAN